MVHEASGRTDVAMPLLPPMFLQLSCNVPRAGAPHIVQPMCACAIFFGQESAAYFSSGDSVAAFAGHKFPGFNEKAVGQSKIYTMSAQGGNMGCEQYPK